jgi:hypothetical protein
MTYVVNRDAYSIAPYFLWQQPRLEPTYHHAVLREFYEKELHDYQESRTPLGLITRAAAAVFVVWAFFFGPILTPALVFFPVIFRDRRMRFPLAAGALFFVGCSVNTWLFAHYYAPATALLLLIGVQSLRHLQHWQWHRRPLGMALARGIPLACCAMLMVRLISIQLHLKTELPWPPGKLERASIQHSLESLPTRQLVIVRYGARHVLDSEWVYNRADIDGSKVVWARDMGDAKNQELLQYFKNRQAWMLDPDNSPPKLSRYSGPAFPIPSTGP